MPRERPQHLAPALVPPSRRRSAPAAAPAPRPPRPAPEREAPRPPDYVVVDALALALGSLDPTSGQYAIEWTSSGPTAPIVSDGCSVLFRPDSGTLRIQCWGIAEDLLVAAPDSVLDFDGATGDSDERGAGGRPQCGVQTIVRLSRISVLLVDALESGRHSVLLVLGERPKFERIRSSVDGNVAHRRSEIADFQDRHASYSSSSLHLRFGTAQQLDCFLEEIQTMSGPRPTRMTTPMNVSFEQLYSDELLDTFRYWLTTHPLGIAFQCEALLQSLVVHTRDLLDVLCPAIDSVFDRDADGLPTVGDETAVDRVARALRTLRQDLQVQRSARMRVWREAATLDSLAHPLVPDLGARFLAVHRLTVKTRSLLPVHGPRTLRCSITPTALTLAGPDVEDLNRVLRLFYSSAERSSENAAPLRDEVFMRVRVTDEDGEHMSADDSADIIYGRIYRALVDGIEVAGRHFEFLGYSMSSLRDHAFWFMTPFDWRGRRIEAEDIRRKLGDFSKVSYWPARLAARISQCFSATGSSVPLAAGELRMLDEVIHNKSVFSDGVSTMSLETSRHLVEQHYLESRSERPANLAVFSSIQIRCNGLKGMLSLDPRLEGRVIHYRPSQVKFASTTDRVEIARTFVRPIIARLCRPHIQLLDHLRVPVKNLLALQEKALTTVRRAFESITRAATFVEHNSLGAPFRLNTTLNDLAQLLGFGLSDIRDPVFRRALQSGLATVVRQIKFHGRIPIPGSWTLVGVMNEFDILEPHEVYACLADPMRKERIYVEGDVVISRSPTHHPGDMQYARAIGRPPAGSPLLSLVNCLVFPQKGSRSVPSMLAGGDLDGDEYVVLLDKTIMPPHTQPPAVLDPVEPLHLGRPSTLDDVARFVCDYMASDQLGRVAKLHPMRVADISRLKSEDPDCLMLAAIFSQLVDFGKTGRSPPDLREKLRKIQRRLKQVTGGELPDFMTSESVLTGQKPWTNFYESPNALGVLFRAIKVGDCFGPLVYGAAGSASITEQSAASSTALVLRPSTPSPAPSPTPRDDHWTTLIDILDEKLSVLGVNTADFDEIGRARCAEILRSYTDDLATACHAHAMHSGDKLIEEEALMATVFAIAGHDRRRFSASEALASALTSLNAATRRAIQTASSNADRADARDHLLAAFYAFQLGADQSHRRAFGGSCFAWLALGMILDVLHGFKSH